PADQIAAPGSDAARTAGRAEGFLAEAMRWLEVSADGDGAGPAGGPPAEKPAPVVRSRILVVDDNADMREYLSSLLAGEYAVAAAADGAAALARVRSDPPDLVLTDVMMPELDGFGLLAALRADPDTSHIPVVMLSARA